MMRGGVGDRRLKPRFEIVGELAGRLEAAVVLSLRDGGRGGALADSPLPLPIGSLHRIRLQRDGDPVSVQVTVRHVRAMTASTGEQRYLIGFEFRSESPALQSVIDGWMALHGEAAS
jgi:hypothetical protein